MHGRLREILNGKTAAKAVGEIKKGDKITVAALEALKKVEWREIVVTEDATMETIESMGQTFDRAIDDLTQRFENKVEKLQRGDEMLPGVMKMVKVFVAVKRKLQPGDKMAGRHGNKGVVSRIMPLENMPYLEDGTPVDLVLNPLGVPSRMNVGQILETHLGWASASLGKKIGEVIDTMQRTQDVAAREKLEKDLHQKLKVVYGEKAYKEDVLPLKEDDLMEMCGNIRTGVPIATPVFDGAVEADINELLTAAGLNVSGQVMLTDGRTGERFERPVTVGYIYMLKLHHLVDDKIHARSIGPYSLVTQQPLGGKAQFGGQRFGEMEVWALEAYGAAYALQELLTVKSDDMKGRERAYEAIVKGQNLPEPGIPESFKVPIKEMQSLCLNVEVRDKGGAHVDLADTEEDFFSVTRELGIDISRPERGSDEEDARRAAERKLS